MCNVKNWCVQPGDMRLMVFESTLAMRSDCTTGEQCSVPPTFVGQFRSHLLTLKIIVLGSVITAKATQRIVGNLYLSSLVFYLAEGRFGKAALMDITGMIYASVLWC